jgi:hypothetical protein
MVQVVAVRLENFSYENWLPALHPHLMSRYPGGKWNYQKPSVAVLVLNTGKQWGRDDEEFFTDLKARAFFQRWEPLSEVPPIPRANKDVYADIGYRVGEGMRLTARQQEALLSQLHDLELRALAAERKAEECNNHAGYLEGLLDQRTRRLNHLVHILEEVNRLLNINVNGDFEETCEVVDSTTGQILFRDTSLSNVYRSLLPSLRQSQRDADQGGTGEQTRNE